MQEPAAPSYKWAWWSSLPAPPVGRGSSGGLPRAGLLGARLRSVRLMCRLLTLRALGLLLVLSTVTKGAGELLGSRLWLRLGFPRRRGRLDQVARPRERRARRRPGRGRWGSRTMAFFFK